MNKKLSLFILLALAAGALVGYTGSILAPLPARDSEKQTDAGVMTQPRFGRTHPAASPAGARKTRLSRGTGQSEMARLDDTMKQYARMNTEELWRELEALGKQVERYAYSPNTTRETLIAYIITRLGQEAPRQTLAQMKNSKELEQYQYSVINAWGLKNPEAAQAYCRESMEGYPEKTSELKRAYIALLLDDSPDKAIDYLFTLPQEECSDYSEDVLFNITSKYPEKMAEFMRKLAPVMKRERWTDSFIAAEWAKADWNAAEQWIKTLPEENRSKIMGDAIAALPLEEALQKIPMLNEQEKMSVLAQLGDSLSRESPVQAIDFLLQNTTEEQAVKIVEKGFYFLNPRDKEFNDYLDKMPAGALKDSLLEKTIRSQAPDTFGNSRFFNPKMEDTLALIEQISSAAKKEKAVDSALDRWLHTDPQKVKSWVGQSTLSEEKKKQFTTWCDNIIESRKEDEQG